MTFDQFIDKWLGKKADWDGHYDGQCVDLFRFYVDEVLGLPQPKGVSGAADFWTNYDSDPNLKNFYDKIPNTPSGIPQKGDVVIWNKKAGGGYGHVSIFIEGDVNQFTSFDQNWPTLSKCTKTKHDYKNVYGWLRPKTISDSTSTPQPEVVVDPQAKIEIGVLNSGKPYEVDYGIVELRALKSILSDKDRDNYNLKVDNYNLTKSLEESKIQDVVCQEYVSPPETLETLTEAHTPNPVALLVEWLKGLFKGKDVKKS